MDSHGNPWSTQSTLMPPQHVPPSTRAGNISGGNVQDTAIDSTSQSTQSTLIPSKIDPPSTLMGNTSEGNALEIGIDSTPSPSVPLYAFPDKLARQKVINSEDVLQIATNILPYHALLGNFLLKHHILNNH